MLGLSNSCPRSGSALERERHQNLLGGQPSAIPMADLPTRGSVLGTPAQPGLVCFARRVCSSRVIGSPPGLRIERSDRAYVFETHSPDRFSTGYAQTFSTMGARSPNQSRWRHRHFKLETVKEAHFSTYWLVCFKPRWHRLWTAPWFSVFQRFAMKTFPSASTGDEAIPCLQETRRLRLVTERRSRYG